MKSVALVLALCSTASANTGESDIIGGTHTKVGDYPTVVFLTLHNFFGMEHAPLCTGTLISPTFVVTAGHCVSADLLGASEAEIATMMEVHFDTVDGNVDQGMIVMAKQIFRAGFDINTIGQKDIALIELVTPVTDRTPTSVNVLPLRAPAMGTVATMVGYGNTMRMDAGETAVEYVIENRTSGPCDVVVPPTDGLPPPQDVNVLCFSQVDNMGKCHGDSGGPTFSMIEGHPMLVGVTSFGDTDCAVFGADTRTDIEHAFLEANVPDLCTEPSCLDDEGSHDAGGCCDTSGKGAPTSVLGIGIVALALRRRRNRA